MKKGRLFSPRNSILCHHGNNTKQNVITQQAQIEATHQICDTLRLLQFSDLH